VITSSSYKGWGTGSIKRDVEEIAKAVQYFRNLKPEGKIVLFGHSTGSQDTMQYLLDMAGGNVPGIDGGVMQAPGRFALVWVSKFVEIRWSLTVVVQRCPTLSDVV
jgi:alpha-beta hydrolase superfamily lysophospholipase